MCFVVFSMSDIKAAIESLEDGLRFYAIGVSSGYGTVADQTLQASIPRFAGSLPRICFVAHLYQPGECQEFKQSQGINNMPGPLLFISEDNPFSNVTVKKRAIIDFSSLTKKDEVKKILASISTHAHDSSFLKKAKNGELLRRIQQTLSKYDGPIGKCLSVFGL